MPDVVIKPGTQEATTGTTMTGTVTGGTLLPVAEKWQYCAKCGTKVEQTHNYCHSCGTQIQTIGGTTPYWPMYPVYPLPTYPTYPPPYGPTWWCSTTCDSGTSTNGLLGVRYCSHRASAESET